MQRQEMLMEILTWDNVYNVRATKLVLDINSN